MILYDPTRVSVLERAGSDFPDTYQTVGENGEFDKCVHVTDSAYDEIISRLAPNEQTKWTRDTLHTHLKDTWKRLMEQHRILNAKASDSNKPSGSIKAQLASKNISQLFAVFNTGLKNNGDDLYAVLVQTSTNGDNTPQPYTLLRSGITLQNSNDILIQIDGHGQPFINYLKNMLENARAKKERIRDYLIYYNQKLPEQNGLKIALQESLKSATYKHLHNSSLVLYESTRVSPVPNGKRIDYTNTYQVVHRDGEFDMCVHVTNDAYDELKRLVSNKQTGKKWTKELLITHLSDTWKRLMEQHRILNAKANRALKPVLESAGISETFAAFNTGLVNENGDDIYAVLVQTQSHGISSPYTLDTPGVTLQDSSIAITIQEKSSPFIKYLKMWGEDGCTEIEIHRNKALRKVVEEPLQRASYEKSYSTSLILYESTRVSPAQVTGLPNTHQVVYKDGGFDECVFVTDFAYDELMHLATNDRTCDKWTKESLHNYLKYTWIRLMEQHRILNAKASDDLVKNLASGGISRTFAAFNTGLANENGEDIYAVVVQTSSKPDDTSPPYTLFRSGITLQHRGIFITIDDKKHPFINYLKKELEDVEKKIEYLIYCNQDLQGKLTIAREEALKRATFFEPRDPKLLLDWTADIVYNATHIIRQRLDRFLEVGVIDEHEAIVVDEKSCKNDPAYEELKYGKYLLQKKYIKMTSNDFYFRRGEFGINACSMLLDRWIEDAKKRVQGTFTLAVPQVYYLPPSTLKSYYCGRLQLLIPLFCDTNKAKLALSLDYNDDTHEYNANTVLRIQWAYSNSRLLAAPQATWILYPGE